ncbi:hypothetical protein E2C01_016574 [Portunus trituberculatus]|uniref:Uncharacterized protein n=1 Tax=Portunus trituberculatus TaxID=210409 RepID=A0A5B7DPS1_PORTR|nr:hypothetical protein [Portunus trituberculatus]
MQKRHPHTLTCSNDMEDTRVTLHANAIVGPAQQCPIVQLVHRGVVDSRLGTNHNKPVAQHTTLASVSLRSVSNKGDAQAKISHLSCFYTVSQKKKKPCWKISNSKHAFNTNHYKINHSYSNTLAADTQHHNLAISPPNNLTCSNHTTITTTPPINHYLQPLCTPLSYKSQIAAITLQHKPLASRTCNPTTAICTNSIHYRLTPVTCLYAQQYQSLHATYSHSTNLKHHHHHHHPASPTPSYTLTITTTTTTTTSAPAPSFTCTAARHLPPVRHVYRLRRVVEGPAESHLGRVGVHSARHFSVLQFGHRMLRPLLPPTHWSICRRNGNNERTYARTTIPPPAIHSTKSSGWNDEATIWKRHNAVFRRSRL